MFEESFASLACWGDLRKPDSGFNGLNLAIERADSAEPVVPPMLQQPGSFWCNVPVVGIRQRAPLVHLLPESIDYWRRIVFLFFRGEAFALVENNFALFNRAFSFSWLRNRRDEFSAAAIFYDPLCWLAIIIKFPMAFWVLIGGIKDRVFEELIVHVYFSIDGCCESSFSLFSGGLEKY